MSKERISGPIKEPLTLSEVKNYLRIEGEDEDALISNWISQARENCEGFTGKALISQIWRASYKPTKSTLIVPGPVRELITINHVVDDVATPLEEGDFHLERDSGRDYLVLDRDLKSGKVEIEFRAGFGEDWNGVPLSLRQGMLRLVAHNHRFRDMIDAPALPAAVVALWRPYRVMRI